MTETRPTTPTSFRRALLLATPILLLALAPASAEAPPERDRELTLAVLNGAGVEALLLSPAPAEPAAIDGPSAQGTVTAECCDGSTVTCEGSSGSFQDADCDNGVQGYCETDEETKSCPAHCSSPSCDPECPSAPSCGQKNGTPCSPDGSEILCRLADDEGCGFCSCSFGTWMCTF